MKKVIFILLLISLGVGVYIYKTNADVTYDTVTKSNITIDIPKNFKEIKLAEYDHSYINKSGTFGIYISSDPSEAVSLAESMKVLDKLFAAGLDSLMGTVYRKHGDVMSDVDVKECGLKVINGIEMGCVTATYNNKKKNVMIKESIYFIIVEDQLVQIDISYELKSREKYQEIVDHVVNSITIQ